MIVVRGFAADENVVAAVDAVVQEGVGKKRSARVSGYVDSHICSCLMFSF